MYFTLCSIMRPWGYIYIQTYASEWTYIFITKYFKSWHLASLALKIWIYPLCSNQDISLIMNFQRNKMIIYWISSLYSNSLTIFLLILFTVILSQGSSLVRVILSSLHGSTSCFCICISTNYDKLKPAPAFPDQSI